MLIDRTTFHEPVFDILIAEHRKIATLLDRALALPATAPEERIAVFRELSHLVRAHARAEQEILFPILDGSYELGHHVREDVAEHAVIDGLLRVTEQTPAHERAWYLRVTVLRDQLLQHFAHEEDVVFPKAHCVIGDPHAMELGLEYELDRDLALERLGRT